MQLLYKAFYRVFRRLAYVDVPLDAGDFSLIDRRVVDAINAMPETHRFLRGLRAWVGFKQIGVPYVRPERMFGTTTNSFRKNLGWARRAIVSFSYAPLDLITGLALVVVAVSFVGLLVQIVLRIVDPGARAPQGLTTLIVLILFLGGIQLLCLAIIGTYLGHMYEEVKGRPPSSSSRSSTRRPAPRRQRAPACAGSPSFRPRRSRRRPRSPRHSPPSDCRAVPAEGCDQTAGASRSSPGSRHRRRHAARREPAAPGGHQRQHQDGEDPARGDPSARRERAPAGPAPSACSRRP